MKFTLKIELGNDSIKTLADVITAIHTSKESLEDGNAVLVEGDYDHIHDLYRNIVGTWKVVS